MSAPSRLKFSDSFDARQAGHPANANGPDLGMRLVQRREEQLVRKALQRAGDPGLILDLPCGDGRFWPVMAEKGSRIIVAADHCSATLEKICILRPPQGIQQVLSLQTSAQDIDLPDSCVDSIFSMDLLTQVPDSMQRMEILKEFYRVARESVIVSICVDGNFESWKHQSLEQAGAPDSLEERIILSRAEAEKEFIAAGFRIQERLDLLPLYSMWRLYVLSKD